MGTGERVLQTEDDTLISTYEKPHVFFPDAVGKKASCLCEV